MDFVKEAKKLNIICKALKEENKHWQELLKLIKDSEKKTVNKRD
jgi:Mg2+/Co2+ transporter CorC